MTTPIHPPFHRGARRGMRRSRRCAPRRVLRLRMAAMFLATLTLLLTATACAPRFPAERVPRMRWLVLPFEQPPSFAETPRAIRGWWWGARTVRQNPRAGALLAETLTRTMGKLDYVSVYSTIDLNYYFADKRDLLAEAYPHLTDPEIQTLIDDVPAVQYARELGADKILTGRILRQNMGQNRSLHWWWSVLEAEVRVIDVGTGEAEWTRHYDLDRAFASQSTLQKDLIEKLIVDMRDDYFAPLAEAAPAR